DVDINVTNQENCAPIAAEIAAKASFSPRIRERKHDASPTLSVLRRPLRRSGRILSQQTRRPGGNANALQRQPRTRPTPARRGEQGYAYELPDRRYDRIGVRRPLPRAAELSGFRTVVDRA